MAETEGENRSGNGAGVNSHQSMRILRTRLSDLPAAPIRARLPRGDELSFSVLLTRLELSPERFYLKHPINVEAVENLADELERINADLETVLHQMNTETLAPESEPKILSALSRIHTLKAPLLRALGRKPRPKAIKD